MFKVDSLFGKVNPSMHEAKQMSAAHLNRPFESDGKDSHGISKKLDFF